MPKGGTGRMAVVELFWQGEPAGRIRFRVKQPDLAGKIAEFDCTAPELRGALETWIYHNAEQFRPAEHLGFTARPTHFYDDLLAALSRVREDVPGFTFDAPEIERVLPPGAIP